MPRKRQGPRLVKKSRRNKKNGKIEKLPEWFVRYIDENGKQREFSTGTTENEEAQEVLEEFLRGQRANRHGQALPHHRYTVAQVIDEYDLFLDGSDAAERLYYSSKHLLPFFGDGTLDAVNIERIDRYVKDAKKFRKVGTIRRELTDLRSAISHAVNMKRIQSFSFPRLPKKPKSKMRFLTRDELAQMYREARKVRRTNEFSKKPFEPYVTDLDRKFNLTLFLIIGYYSGARKSAIFELKWSNVNFKTNRLDFNQPDLEETNKRRSKIPMSPYLRRILHARYKRYGHLSDYVFHRKSNPTIRVQSVDKAYKKAVDAIGLKDVTPHTLRHTRVSEYAQAGEKIVTVSKFMAMSMQTIFDVYAHFDDKDVEDLAERTGRSQNVHTTKDKDQQTKEKQGKEGEDNK